MKKLIAVITAALIIALSLCACGSDSSNSDREDVSQETGTAIVSTNNKVDEAKKKKLMTWSINLNGVDFKLPCDASELKKIGFEYTESGSLESKKYSIGVYPKNSEGKSLSSQLWNPTDQTLSYQDCKVGEIKIGLGEELKAVLPEGLKFDEIITSKKIKKLYGEPDNYIKGKNYEVLKYEEGINQFIEFFLYTEERMQKYSSVAIQNFS